jgi:hypothetical protein
MAAAWGAAGMGAQRLITIFLISVHSLVCGIYFCNTYGKGIKLMAKSFPWAVVLLTVSTIWQKPLNKKEAGEFSSVKARKATL